MAKGIAGILLLASLWSPAAMAQTEMASPWIVSVQKDPYTGGDRVIITPPQRGPIGFVCFNHDLTIAVDETAPAYEGDPDYFDVLFKVDDQPAIHSAAVTVDRKSFEIGGLRGMLEQLRDGRALQLRFKSDRAQWDRTYDIRGIKTALPALEKDCPADKVMQLVKP